MSKAARQVLNIPSGYARDPQFKLSPYQCRLISNALGYSAANDIVDNLESPTVAPSVSEVSLLLRPDPPAEWNALQFRDLNYGILFHPEVADYLREMVPLRKRLGIVLQHLGAHGKTSVVKGCGNEANRGWLRSPLGGKVVRGTGLFITLTGIRGKRKSNASLKEICRKNIAKTCR